MQVIHTTTSSLQLASFLLTLVSHLCHLVGIFYSRFFLTLGCHLNKLKFKSDSAATEFKSGEELRGTATTQEAPSTLQHLLGHPSATLTQLSPLLCQRKRSCGDMSLVQLMFLGSGHYSLEAENSKSAF